jgi:hypothetical protein
MVEKKDNFEPTGSYNKKCLNCIHQNTDKCFSCKYRKTLVKDISSFIKKYKKKKEGKK